MTHDSPLKKRKRDVEMSGESKGVIEWMVEHSFYGTHLYGQVYDNLSIPPFPTSMEMVAHSPAEGTWQAGEWWVSLHPQHLTTCAVDDSPLWTFILWALTYSTENVGTSIKTCTDRQMKRKLTLTGGLAWNRFHATCPQQRESRKRKVLGLWRRSFYYEL